MGARRAARGVTLVEVLITLAIIALMSGAAMLGTGAVGTARMKSSAVMVAGAVRVAYAHANAVSKPVRLVFDFEKRAILLEEASGRLELVKRDRTGGAEAATEAERMVQEETDAILKGPRAPRPSFQPSKAPGFTGEEGMVLEQKIRFLSVETGHTEEPEIAERAYLYFWPGGQTERAAIVLTKGDGEADDDSDFMTVLVAPLTGKAEIKKGKHAMPRPRTDAEESERQDSNF